MSSSDDRFRLLLLLCQEGRSKAGLGKVVWKAVVVMALQNPRSIKSGERRTRGVNLLSDRRARTDDEVLLCQAAVYHACCRLKHTARARHCVDEELLLVIAKARRCVTVQHTAPQGSKVDVDDEEVVVVNMHHRHQTIQLPRS
jgi:hypothetical protein